MNWKHVHNFRQKKKNITSSAVGFLTSKLTPSIANQMFTVQINYVLTETWADTHTHNVRNAQSNCIGTWTYKCVHRDVRMHLEMVDGIKQCWVQRRPYAVVEHASKRSILQQKQKYKIRKQKRSKKKWLEKVKKNIAVKLHFRIRSSVTCQWFPNSIKRKIACDFSDSGIVFADPVFYSINSFAQAQINFASGNSHRSSSAIIENLPKKK